MAKKNITEDKPEVSFTKEKIILGFFDVLGFSKRVETEDVISIANLYQKLITTTVQKEEVRSLGLSGLDNSGYRYPMLFNFDVQYAYFSDTIFMWVPHHPHLADLFISHIATFICEALALDVPIRGAITIGEAIMQKETGTYIGMPIVEGASCEKIQEWLGVAFAPSAVGGYFLAEINPKQMIEYDIPVKIGKDKELPPLALDWSRRWEELYGYSAIQKLEKMNEKEPHPKLLNTIKFVEHCHEDKDWYLLPPEKQQGKRLKMQFRKST